MQAARNAHSGTQDAGTEELRNGAQIRLATHVAESVAAALCSLSWGRHVPKVTPAGAPQRPDLREDAAMADSWRAPGGWRVRIVTLAHTPNHRDGSLYRLSQYGTHVADVRSVAEIARYLDLSGLELEGDEGGLGLVTAPGKRSPGRRVALGLSPASLAGACGGRAPWSWLRKTT
jgi:hypothetical protein